MTNQLKNIFSSSMLRSPHFFPQKTHTTRSDKQLPTYIIIPSISSWHIDPSDEVTENREIRNITQ